VSSVRSRDWKLLEYHEDHHVELYKLSDDRREANNLAAKQPDKAADLRRRLDDWRKSINAQMPSVNSEFKPKAK
jgi:arylsulfatase A